MEAEAVTRIADLAIEAEGKVVEVHGRPFSAQPLSLVPEPRAETVVLHTLTGLVAFVEEDVDQLPLNESILHVVGPREVAICGPLLESTRKRETFARAVVTRDGFPFGSYLEPQEITTRLQAEFTAAGDRADVLRVLGTIKDENVRTLEDDGVTQQVSASSGVALSENVTVPNPVRLAPYRTFPEVDQPESPFVLRVRKGRQGVEAGLFEADGGAWRNEAIQRVADWLGKRVSLPPIIA